MVELVNSPTLQIRAALKYVYLSAVITVATYAALRTHPEWIDSANLIYIPSYLALVIHLFASVSRLPKIGRMGMLLPILFLHGCSALMFWFYCFMGEALASPYAPIAPLIAGPFYYMAGVVIHVALLGIPLWIEDLRETLQLTPLAADK